MSEPRANIAVNTANTELRSWTPILVTALAKSPSAAVTDGMLCVNCEGFVAVEVRYLYEFGINLKCVIEFVT